jgi:predicted nucleotidyltransferase
MTQQTRVWTTSEILNTLTAHGDQFRAMGARRLGLFGSYRRGTPKPDSDMDFLITLERPSFDDYMNVKFLLEDLFGCEVDLVLEHTLKPRLRPAILSEVVYAEGI